MKKHKISYFANILMSLPMFNVVICIVFSLHQCLSEFSSFRFFWTVSANWSKFGPWKLSILEVKWHMKERHSLHFRVQKYKYGWTTNIRINSSFLKWTTEPILHVKHINYMVTFSLVFNQISLVPMHFPLSYFSFESAKTWQRVKKSNKWRKNLSHI